MNLFFFTETRFCKIQGVIYAPEQMSMVLWDRYLAVFEHVFVCARVTESNKPIMKGMVPILSEKVSFCELPYYVGPFQFLKKSLKIKKAIKKLIKPGNAFILRVPGNIGESASKYLISHNIPYATEVVGDPEEVFSNGANSSRLSPFFKILFSHRLKSVVRKAAASLYVTDYILQKKYPCADDAFSVGASNVILTDEDYLREQPKVRENLSSKVVRFMAIGTLAQMYKAPDIVLKALALVRNKGIRFHLTWFGDGVFRDSMIRLAETLNISDSVSFPGNVLRQTINEEFNNTDIFLHASRAEGLPRALIEAMAKGKPAIGTKIAGIPEILSPEAIIPVNDVESLSEKILLFINNTELMEKLAVENLKTSHRFHKEILTKKRNEFFNQVKLISVFH